MLFQNGELMVCQLELEDAKFIAKWLSNPLVLEYYEGRDNPFNLEKVIEKFFSREDVVTGCIVGYKDKPIGYIQFYPLDDESKQLFGYENFSGVVYGMDQFIGEVEYWNKGIGALLVKSMVKYVVEEQHVDRKLWILKPGIIEPYIVTKNAASKKLNCCQKMNSTKENTITAGY